jgi:hypothetical protein
LAALEGAVDNRWFTLDNPQIGPRRPFLLPTPVFPVLECRQFVARRRPKLASAGVGAPRPDQRDEDDSAQHPPLPRPS